MDKPIVKVHWYDTSFWDHSTPMTEKEVLRDASPMPVTTYGILLRDATDVVLAGSIGYDDGEPNYLDIHCIPKEVVKSIVEIGKSQDES